MAFIEYTYQSTYPELFKTEEALPQMGDNEVLVELFFGVCIGGFDHKLVEKIFSIEPSLRYQSGVTKALLKKVAAPYLPDSIVNRKKKGFSSPYLEWLIEAGELECIMNVNQQTGLFDDEVLQEYINRGKQGRFKQHLWGLYLFSRWYEKEFL